MKGEHWGRAIAVSGPNRLRGWKALVAVWLTVLGLNVLIVLGFRGGTWDAVEFTAQFRFVADSVKQGELLQWTPLINGGCPAGFEPELGAASPLLLGVAWISNGSEFGFRLYWLTLWCLGGTGIFLLACHLGASPRLAYVAAVGYAFSAIYMSHAEHTSYLATMSLFPWALWRLDVGLVCRRWPAAAEAGAIWGLSALGGYPPLVGAGGAYLFAWSLGRLCFGGDPSPERLESHGIAMPQVAECFGKPGFVAAAAAVCAAVGLVVMSPTYLGFLAESRGYTDRGVAMPWQQVSTYGFMPPAAMTTFASPYLALWNSLSGRPLWQSDVTLASICVSPLLLVLALSMGGRAADKRFRCFLWLLAFGCLVLAFGGRTPIYGLLYDALPPLRFARLSSPFRLYYVLTVVVLAVMAGLHLERHAGQDGADDWRSHGRVSLVVGTLAVATFIAVVCAAGWWQSTARFLPWLASGHVVAIWTAVSWLSLRGARGTSLVRRQIVRRSWVALAIADAALTLALCQRTVCESSCRPLWKQLDAARVASLDLTARGLQRRPAWTETKGPWCFGANLFTKVPELVSGFAMANHFHRRYAADPILGPSALGPQRIWFSPTAPEVPLSDGAFGQFLAAVGHIGRPAIVVSNRNEPLRNPESSASGDGPGQVRRNPTEIAAAELLPVELLDYSPNRLAFDVRSPRDGWLLATDRWARGWRATVNDEETEVWIGNFIFRAVRVHAGANHVVFSYHPFGHPWLLLLSWATMGTVAVAAVARFQAVEYNQGGSWIRPPHHRYEGNSRRPAICPTCSESSLDDGN